MIVRAQATVPWLTKSQSERVSKGLRVTNPKYLQHARFSRSKYGEKPPKWLRGWQRADEEKQTGAFLIPRAWFYACQWHEHEDVKLDTISIAADYPDPLHQLYDYQDTAADAVFDLVNDNDEAGRPTDCVVVMATSGGKTVLGMHLCWHSGERALIVVPTQEIEAAWLTDCEKMFGIKPEDVGRIRGDKFSLGDQFTIGSVQTLMNRPPEFWNHFGITVFDECHRMPATKFISVLQNCRSHIRVGLTATDVRKDGMMKAVRWHLGENVYKDLTPRNSVPLTYHAIGCDYSLKPTREFNGEVEWDWHDVMEKLIRSSEHLVAICNLVMHISMNHKGCILITSSRTEHIDIIANALHADFPGQVAVLTGKTKGRKKLYEEIREGRYFITVATQSIVAEGASCPKWHHVVIATPFSDGKTMEQLKGRPIRIDPEDQGKKTGHVWDLAPNVGMLRNMMRSRYQAIKPHTQLVQWLKYDSSTNFTEVKREKTL